MQVLLLLDVDFMVSSSLNELQHSTWLRTAVSQGVLVVLPALEPVRSDAAAQQAVVRACQGMIGCWQDLVGCWQNLPRHCWQNLVGCWQNLPKHC